ncbi:putative thiamine pyrophosphokinase-related protein [Diplocarpon rosae]|nr:putative thiamine pyrophosphokinase-related protein [Diplocarpon rosae]
MLTFTSFPYPSTAAHTSLISTLYILVSSSGTPIGYLTELVFNALAKVPISIKGELEVSRIRRTVVAFQQPTERERSAAVAATCAYWRTQNTFAVLKGWRDELYPVYGPDNELLFSVERSASCLFGVVTYGVHMMAYTRDESASYGMKVWVARRAKTKQTYPGMLDNTVAGGMATGEAPLESIVRECEEEASLPEDLVRANIKAQGTVTYSYIREGRAGGETGLVQPECQYVFDLELTKETICRPNDSEVDGFVLWSVEEIEEALGKGDFKPNCAVVVLDFFVRKGILTAENEENYEEIVKRLHRELEFPGPHKPE